MTMPLPTDYGFAPSPLFPRHGKTGSGLRLEKGLRKPSKTVTIQRDLQLGAAAVLTRPPRKMKKHRIFLRVARLVGLILGLLGLRAIAQPTIFNCAETANPGDVISLPNGHWQTLSLPDADLRAGRPRCGGRKSNFLAGALL